MATLSTEDRVNLESMIDRSSLADVLTALADICHGKAAHIEENWQDRPLARVWSNAGVKVGRTADSAEKANV